MAAGAQRAVGGEPELQQQQQQQQQQQRKSVSLQELYLQVRDKPCRVADVRFEPAAPPAAPEGPGGGGGEEPAPRPLRLKQEVLDRALQRVYDATTLREVHEELERAVDVLRQLEVFDDVTALIDSQPLDEPDACSVQLVLQEVNRYKYGGGAYTQAGEYSFEGNVAARNVLGVADQWALTGELGTRSSKNFAASFRLPRAGGSGFTPEFRVYQAFANQQLHSSWTEAMRGVSLAVHSAENPGVSVGYEYGWRSLSTGQRAGRHVRSQAGDYLKAALRATYTLDGGGRNPAEALPTEGWQLRLAGEVGGCAPGAERLRYLRQQAHLSWALPVADGLSLHLEAAAGVLLPCWSPGCGAAPTPLPERFYLGGVESNLRGFETRGIGPTEARRSGPSGAGAAADDAAGAAAAAGAPARDALGGDLFANLYAALLLRLPGKAGDVGVHGHVFANGGGAVLLGAAPEAGGGGGGLAGAGAALRERLRAGGRQLGQTFRWSTGFGLLFPTQLGRLEANYCWVLTSQEHDRVKRGFSFGFAANMGY